VPVVDGGDFFVNKYNNIILEMNRTTKTTKHRPTLKIGLRRIARESGGSGMPSPKFVLIEKTSMSNLTQVTNVSDKILFCFLPAWS